jgi:hypothetical protein
VVAPRHAEAAPFDGGRRVTATKLAEVVQGETFEVGVTRGSRAARERCEQELARTNLRLALPHRAAWTDLTEASDTHFISVRDATGVCGVGIGVDVHETRSLPGHHVWRVERLGVALPGGFLAAGLRALAEVAGSEPRLLRLEVRVFSRDCDVRERLSATLAALGFQRRPRPTEYHKTVVVDLGRPEEQVFESLHATARRHVRAIGKRPVTLGPITDVGYAARLDALCRESFARSGGRYQGDPWRRIIPFTVSNPGDARLVGLWRADRPGPDGLLAFALGYWHGEHAEYRAAGSTRAEDLKMPLGYAAAWDLIVWSKRLGARWFDFGGVTEGRSDNLGRISDFKRMFSRNVVECAEEWVLEVSPVRSALVTLMAGAASTWRGWWR